MKSCGRTPLLLETTPLVLNRTDVKLCSHSAVLLRGHGSPPDQLVQVSLPDRLVEVSLPDQLVEVKLSQTSQLLNKRQLTDANLVS